MAYRQTDRTRRHAREKEDAFLAAAHGLVARHGFAGAKVSAIARACDASTGSLYSYFASRDDLLAAVFRTAADRELAAVRRAVEQAADEAAERLGALVDTFTLRALRGRRMAWSLLFEPVSPAVEAERLVYRSAYARLGEEVIREGVERGRFAPQHPAVAAAAVIGAISEALVGQLSPVEHAASTAPGLSDTLLVAEIRAFCFRALGPPASGARSSGDLAESACGKGR